MSQIESFKDRWLERFGLSRGQWRKELPGALAERPFCDQKSAKELLKFLFGELPGLLEKDESPETLRLAEAFGWCCFAFWQCGSAFPSFPENHAGFLRGQLERPPAKRLPEAGIVASIILGHWEGKTDDQSCGLNRLVLDKPEVVRKSERLIHDGRFDEYLKAPEKYEEYDVWLRESAEFRNDWEALKKQFRRHLKGRDLFHRTLIPERNWERGEGAAFSSPKARFQALFDLFCWKYYLWGMSGDKPLLLKPSVVLTPFGTQIFIPGYMSFDASRDLHWNKIKALHNARGVMRQGPGFSTGRNELHELKIRAKEADKEARSRKLKGEARYEYICKRIGFIDEPDYRRTRNLLR
ncbi:MAG: hypothetical protein KF712_09605 [Akkermansiaceae bacterium]|nr:hypothetical protein [Akkermansiaceae bacterium]